MRWITLLFISCIAFSGYIKPDAVDGVHLGMPINKAISVVDSRINLEIKKETESIEGEEYTVYNVYSIDTLMYQIDIEGRDTSYVSRIKIYTDRWKTQKGIGVGNTLKDLREVYTLLEANTGEGEIVISTKENTIQYVIGFLEVPQSWWSNPKVELLPDDLVIEYVLLQ